MSVNREQNVGVADGKIVSPELISVQHGNPVRDVPEYALFAPQGLMAIAAAIWALGSLTIAVVFSIIALLALKLAWWPMWSFVTRRRAQRRKLEGLEATERDSEATRCTRLCCYGEPVELHSLRFVSTNAFEPRCFSLATGPSTWLAGAGALAVGIVGISLGCSGAYTTAFMMLTLCALTWISLLNRTVIRVQPGRLDILKAGFFATESALARTADLHDARVICRFDKRVLLVKNDRCEMPTVEIDLSETHESHMLARTVFSAAAATPGEGQRKAHGNGHG